MTTNTPNQKMAMAPSAAPTPMPAFAPVLSPLLFEWLFEFDVGDDICVVVSVDDVLEATEASVVDVLEPVTDVEEAVLAINAKFVVAHCAVITV